MLRPFTKKSKNNDNCLVSSMKRRTQRLLLLSGFVISILALFNLKTIFLFQDYYPHFETSSEVRPSDILLEGKENIKLTLISIWSGTRPVSSAFIKSTRTCNTDSRVNLLVIFDPIKLEDPRAFENAPSNVIILPIVNLTKYVHEMIDERVYPGKNHPYFELGRKICDFRFFFGLIFKDQLHDSTHWGWIDAHAIFGDILGPVSQYGKIFRENDVISLTRLEKYSVGTRGTLTVLKNDDKMNHLYLRLPLFEKTVYTEDLLGYDEIVGSNVVLLEGVSYASIDFLIDGDVPGAIDRISYDESNRLIYDLSPSNPNFKLCDDGETTIDSSQFYIKTKRKGQPLSKAQNPKLGKPFGTVIKTEKNEWYLLCHSSELLRGRGADSSVSKLEVIGVTCRHCEKKCQ